MTKGILKTSKGDFGFELYDQDAPLTVQNFIKLVKEGYYNGVPFHRVIPGFMSQGGQGKPLGYTVPCELRGNKQYHDTGVMSMAHAGRDTGSSQFFICHQRASTQHLDRNHTCFGKITEGIERVQDIAQGTIINEIEIAD